MQYHLYLVQNYTTLGFHKVRAPPEMMTILSKFWKRQFTSLTNDHDVDIINSLPNEIWSRGDTYTNHWSSPTKLVSLTDSPSRKILWESSKTILEQWTGVQLSPSSMYGVRIYTNGSVLAPHVDRTPLIISAVVNVAQDVDEDWPLEVYGRDGKAYNLTLEAGEMILYEGHSVIHGRPFPLKGRYYAVSVGVEDERLFLSRLTECDATHIQHFYLPNYLFRIYSYISNH